MDEQRSEPRHKTLLRAEITTSQGEVLACSVRDLSTKGARLGIGDLAWIPSTFRLQILERGLQAEAEVRWRDKTQIGVRFRSVSRLQSGRWVEAQDVA
jgi:hypothetical protein